MTVTYIGTQKQRHRERKMDEGKKTQCLMKMKYETRYEMNNTKLRNFHIVWKKNCI